MPDKKTYEWNFHLSEKIWSLQGRTCPDCVDESNYEAWNRYLSKQISKLLCAETMQTEEFQKELEAVRKNEEERLAHQKSRMKRPRCAEGEVVCFNRRNVDWDCYRIWQLMLEENKNIEQ